MQAKKSLGQHFLTSRRVIARMIASAELTQSNTVLEAGPGRGILTEALLAAAGRVIAIEKDDRLIPLLRERFRSEISIGKLILVHNDILNFNPLSCKLLPAHYKLVANIPYYISGKFLQHFLSGEAQPERCVLLLQKEVAQRIVARDGKESILSLSIKAYGLPRLIQIVKAGNFSPPPKVDSAILSINGISRAFFSGVDEQDFFTLLKTGFSSKRKFLASNLKKLFPESVALCASAGIDPKARAEDLSLDDWKNILLRADEPI